MVENISVSGTPVKFQLDSGGESFTVPTGEVWKGDLIVSGEDNNISINGQTIGRVDEPNFEQRIKTKIILTGGDTVSMADSGGGSLATGFTGFRVDNVIGNNVVSQTVSYGSSFTVPTGEIWRGYILAGIGGDDKIGQVQINNNGFYELYNKMKGVPVTLSGGDTVSMVYDNPGSTDSLDSGGIHIGAFVD